VIKLVDLDAVMDTLIKISKEKYLLLKKVYKFTVDQKKVIEEVDVTSLNDIIDKKQAEIRANFKMFYKKD
jgi:hypothetical protein